MKSKPEVTPLELETPWTLWYDTEKSGHHDTGTWTSALQKLATFDTIPSFWGVFSLAPAASRLTPGSNYSLFRRDAAPVWESHAEGGKWNLNVPPRFPLGLDSLWQDTALALVGEAFGRLGVVGAVAGIRSSGRERIALWTESCERQEALNIGRIWRKILALPDKITIEFFPHSSRMAIATTLRSGPLRPLFTM